MSGEDNDQRTKNAKRKLFKKKKKKIKRLNKEEEIKRKAETDTPIPMDEDYRREKRDGKKEPDRDTGSEKEGGNSNVKGIEAHRKVVRSRNSATGIFMDEEPKLRSKDSKMNRCPNIFTYPPPSGRPGKLF